ncbi:hypothetical protein EB796_023793 [Bugula neritina]|uniref:P2X purinoceptor n=1 Tax=Bugula neritina TaxID=10212 RepID=A0A7J7IXI2_BUGNE|nr:hypothetical protein EB796_023793 [Bugula neritina]
MGSKEKVKNIISSSFFVYSTPKVVQVNSKFIGILNRMMQLTLFTITVVWVFILNNGYQFIDNGAVGGTTTKVKGVAYSNSTDPRVGERVWDSIDLHVPPQDNGAFFLMTNVIVTENQTSGTCPSVKGHCETDIDCLPIRRPYHMGNGVTNGICNQTTKTCMIRAWCPTEDDSPPIDGDYARLEHTADFTVLIKNHVYFPYFDISRSNLIESVNKTYLTTCQYNVDEHKYCPIFRIGDIVSLSRLEHTADFTVLIKNHVYFPYFDISRSNLIESVNKTYLTTCQYNVDEHKYCPIFRIGDIVSLSRSAKDSDYHLDRESYYRNLANAGGVINVLIQWSCNFDFSTTQCKPVYKFKRLDNKYNSAPGYNFRYPIYYKEHGHLRRQLVKAYGILFLLKTEATARAFDFKTFILNIGSSLALLGIAKICSDIVLLHIHQNREHFKKFIMAAINVKRDSFVKGDSISTDNSSDANEKRISLDNMR